MSFKAVITEEGTDVQGTITECLTGLLFYIKKKEKSGIPENIIKQVIGLKYNDINKKKYEKEMILDNGKVKIQKIDFNNVTKEEAKKIFDEEIISKLFD